MSAARDVAVVSTGTANTASVFAGLRRAGAAPFLCTRASDVAAAERLVMPGVGSFGAAMATLAEHGLVEALRERVLAGRTTLCICLGLQLLCEASDESPGTPGLGILPATARRFPTSVRVPQLGWNRVAPAPDSDLLEPGFAYFANSYCLTDPLPGWRVATADHGTRFVAAAERGAVLTCQFHPELSGAWGLSLLDRWLACNDVVPC